MHDNDAFAPETKWWFASNKKELFNGRKSCSSSQKDKWWSAEVFLIAFHFTTKYWPPSVQIYFCHPWCLNKKPFINLKKKHKPSNNQLIWINMAGIEYYESKPLFVMFLPHLILMDRQAWVFNKWVVGIAIFRSFSKPQKISIIYARMIKGNRKSSPRLFGYDFLYQGLIHDLFYMPYRDLIWIRWVIKDSFYIGSL